jgi:hypothetical protein
MGGFGSGRHGGKGLTSDYRALDVWQLGRLGRLTPGQAFDWSWMRDGEIVASIQVQTEADRVVLSYRHRRGAATGNRRNTRCGWIRRTAPLAGGGRGFAARRMVAGSEWPCSTAGKSSLVGTATG